MGIGSRIRHSLPQAFKLEIHGDELVIDRQIFSPDVHRAFKLLKMLDMKQEVWSKKLGVKGRKSEVKRVKSKE